MIKRVQQSNAVVQNQKDAIKREFCLTETSIARRPTNSRRRCCSWRDCATKKRPAVS